MTTRERRREREALAAEEHERYEAQKQQQLHDDWRRTVALEATTLEEFKKAVVDWIDNR